MLQPIRDNVQVCKVVNRTPLHRRDHTQDERTSAYQELPHSEPTVGPPHLLRHLSYAAPIPHLMRLFGFPHIDLVKLDLEGAEARVLSHTAPLLWLKDAQAVLVQLHDHAASGLGVAQVSGPVVDLMRTRGFTVNHTGEFTLFMREQQAAPGGEGTTQGMPETGLQDNGVERGAPLGVPVAADDVDSNGSL